MRKSALGAAILAGLLAAACSGGGPKPATPTATEAAGAATATATAAAPESPIATASPAAATATPAGIDWSHRLAVYVTQVRLQQTANRLFPIQAVVTWDIDAGKLAASVPLNGDGDYPVGAALAGRDVLLATETKAERAHLDGTGRTSVFVAGQADTVQDIRVSPDSQLLAIVVSPHDSSLPGTLRIIDLKSGVEQLRVNQSDEQFTGLRGHFWQVQWRTDGQGVLVSFATLSEMYGSLATIFLDGRVRVEDVQGYGNISPTGTTRAGDIGEIGCMFVGSHEIVIRDLDNARTVVRARSETTVYTPWEWSPDGTQFVFLQQQAQTCDELSAAKQVAYVVTMIAPSTSSFGAPTRVDDLAALHRQWYGDRLFSADCDSGDQPLTDRWGHPRLVCSGTPPPEGQAVTVRVGGKDAGQAVAPQPVAVIAP